VGAGLPLIPTTIVGSYPQPEWLIDRAQLSEISPPRVRMRELWRVPEPFLEQAQDDATALTVRDLERAGIDVLTDGEIRRESYCNRFLTALDGLDLENPGQATSRTGRAIPVARIVGPIRRPDGVGVQVRDVRFLRGETDRPIKITLPGPFTMAHQVRDEHYYDDAALAMDFAAAVNAEVLDLDAAGADVVQIDEPLLQAWPEDARRYAVAVIDRALRGARCATALHTCFGYGHIVADRPEGYPFLAELNDCAVGQLSLEAAQLQLHPSDLAKVAQKTIVLGVIDIVDPAVETPEIVADRIRAALRVVPPERLIAATDCGLKYLPREVAFAKLVSLVEGARRVRAELA
jgi:5-methyltetrahydropteroyltriglutamate--homocysteine methyltransferase